jgi:hypothetical protein
VRQRGGGGLALLLVRAAYGRAFPGLPGLVSQRVRPLLDGPDDFLAERGEFRTPASAGADQQGTTEVLLQTPELGGERRRVDAVCLARLGRVR